MEQSRAEKRRLNRERQKAKLLTFGEFEFWVDRYHDRFVVPQIQRIDQLEWRVLPFWKRWWLVFRAWWAEKFGVKDEQG